MSSKTVEEAAMEWLHSAFPGDVLEFDDCDMHAAFTAGAAHGAAEEREARWQPIETAPRNGLNFLACSAASSVFLAHWANGVVDSSDYNDGYSERYATHWMPLPEPPRIRQRGEK